MPPLFHYEDKTENPPAPFISVQVRHMNYPERARELPAKLDTGADISAIPDSVIRTLGLREAERLLVSGFDGRIVQVVLYAVQIDLPNGQNLEINALGIPADYILLGRDVLNLLRLLLDGPALTLEILEAANR